MFPRTIRAPVAATSAGRIVFTLPMEGTVMGSILDEGAEPNAAAAAWLKANPAVLDGWLEGVTTFDGQPGLAAVKAHLGL